MPKPKNCGNCNYSREPGAISPDPKQDSVWCSNSKSRRYMTYITVNNRCKQHQEPTPEQIAAADRFLGKMSEIADPEPRGKL